MSDNSLTTVSNAIMSVDEILVVNGSVSSPSISFINSTSSGLFWSAVDGIGLSVEGTKTANFSSSFVDSIVPIGVTDSSAPTAPTVATEGYLYKKTGDDNLYWITQGGGEVSVSTAGAGGNEYSDADFKIFDETNTNRKLRFDLSNLTADTDYVIDVPIFISAAGVLAAKPNSTSLACGESSYNITGTNNTFYGVACGTGAVTGSYNSAFGHGAFESADGSYNTAVGFESINTGTASYNTAVGAYALSAADGCTYNTAIGYKALENTVSHSYNTAVGFQAGQNIQADYCIAVGHNALGGVSNVTGDYNLAIGAATGTSITSGANNIMLGYQAGDSITTGNNNIVIGRATDVGSGGLSDTIVIGTSASVSASNRIVIGNTATHTSNFQAGIRGVTTANNDAIAVLVDSGHQLGTVSSSSRYKENIIDIGNTDYLYNLRPVSFNYKTDESKKKTYGLIAEEVEEVLPDIVVYKDVDGENVPETIQYHLLTPLLLNMIILQKQRLEKLRNKYELLIKK